MKKKIAGFTLIEVLLSITILATLSALAARAISQAVVARTKLQGQIDDVSRMRDSMRLFDRDVNLAFHHRDIELELADLVKKTTPAAAPPGGLVPTTTLSDGAGTPGDQTLREVARKDPSTHFVGNENSVSFVTMNNARMIRNLRQADFIEVGYSLRDCRSSDGKTTSKCLWRRSAPIVDEDVTRGGDDIVLLENVSEFALKYIGKGKQDWVTVWRSDKGGDGVTRGNFPAAVQISITVEKADNAKGKKKYSMQVVSSVHFPNNKETANAGTSTNQGTPVQ